MAQISYRSQRIVEEIVTIFDELDIPETDIHLSSDSAREFLNLNQLFIIM